MEFFNFKQKKIEGEGVALDFSRDGHLLALGITPNPLQFQGHIVLLNSSTLSEVQRFEIQDKRLVSLKFSLDRDLLYVLLQDNKYDYHLCSILLSTGEIKKMASYGGTELCKSLDITDNGNYLAVVGVSVEIWDLRFNYIVKAYSSDDIESSLQAQFFSNRLIGIGGLELNEIIVYDFLTGAQEQRFLKPYTQSRQILVSNDKTMVLVSGIGIGGTFVYDLKTEKRVLEKKFNKDTLNSHFLFAINDSQIVRIGSRGFSSITTQDEIYMRGKRYEPSYIICSAASHSTPCFSFIQENYTLNLVWFQND
ncbi:WD40 repeat domain-containing protein [Aureispira anguillae]|uniref:Uncharacterized protein n=1 Tax=Aureispira anguillae TaxID=2864201 RepID=A0A916DX08_9BACT|nr:hypothetical protein [Aureispira anguillae]BDS15387.1 hypothetical protein AsAng_0061710 [Aureispira anguillae]